MTIATSDEPLHVHLALAVIYTLSRYSRIHTNARNTYTYLRFLVFASSWLTLVLLSLLITYLFLAYIPCGLRRAAVGVGRGLSVRVAVLRLGHGVCFASTVVYSTGFLGCLLLRHAGTLVFTSINMYSSYSE